MAFQMTKKLPASFRIQRLITISYPFVWDITPHDWETGSKRFEIMLWWHLQGTRCPRRIGGGVYTQKRCNFFFSIFLDIPTSEDETSTLSQNVGNQLITL
jgi:hypothetical protein